MTKLIVIAGIKRSASTWMFNAVRLCLLHAGRTVRGGGREVYSDPGSGYEYGICKTHPFEREIADNADWIFTTDRDDMGIRYSLKRCFGSSLTDHRLSRMRDNLNAWKRRCGKVGCYHAHFDFIITDPTSVVADVARILELGFKDADVMAVCKALDAIRPPEEGHDAETLLFPGHISEKYLKGEAV